MSSLLYDNWTWSYSRIQLFEQCPFAFAQRYLYKVQPERNFYSDFGTFMHRIHERYYRGQLKTEELVSYYIANFSRQVPDSGDAKRRSEYFLSGLRYFEDGIYQPQGEIIGVEKHVRFTVGGYKFQGIIDLLCRKEDGMLEIIDHKSHNLRPPSGRKTPTKYDEEREAYFKQLILYAEAVQQLGLGQVSTMTFNCFKVINRISKQYSDECRNEALSWAVDQIHRIEQAKLFFPSPDFFYCRNLCDSRNECDYRE